jgi:hypothetical protein
MFITSPENAGLRQILKTNPRNCVALQAVTEHSGRIFNARKFGRDYFPGFSIWLLTSKDRRWPRVYSMSSIFAWQI